MGAAAARTASRVTPALRYYTQSAAYFYHGSAVPQRLRAGRSRTRADTRLAAFGAITAGVRFAKAFADGWSVDLARRPTTGSAGLARWSAPAARHR